MIQRTKNVRKQQFKHTEKVNKHCALSNMNYLCSTTTFDVMQKKAYCHMQCPDVVVRVFLTGCDALSCPENLTQSLISNLDYLANAS